MAKPPLHEQPEFKRWHSDVTKSPIGKRMLHEVPTELLERYYTASGGESRVSYTPLDSAKVYHEFSRHHLRRGDLRTHLEALEEELELRTVHNLSQFTTPTEKDRDEHRVALQDLISSFSDNILETARKQGVSDREIDRFIPARERAQRNLAALKKAGH
jgi:hypothetical protein